MNEQGDSVTFVSTMVTYVPTNTYEDRRAQHLYAHSELHLVEGEGSNAGVNSVMSRGVKRSSDP